MVLLFVFDDNAIGLRRFGLALEERTARLTILIDPRKKALFERLCAEEDTTPSQVVRRLIRAYIEERTGKPWVPEPDMSDAAATATR
jgi:hypothetical protein